MAHKRLHLECLKANKIYIGFFEGIGYLYKCGSEMFTFSGKGFCKL